MKQTRLWISFLLLWAITSLTRGQSAFSFTGTTIAPGTTEHLTITFADEELETIIPITIFHGMKDGQVLGITAGVHGYEYAPILAGQALLKSIDPTELTGTIILVQIANVASFLGRSPYFNPLDGKNLNRVFPGNPEGTLTEQIAHFISQQVIARCDFFVDMHSGDAPEDLMPYSAYYQHDDFPIISESGRQMAASMGFDFIIVFETTTKDYMKATFPSLYCSAEAFKQGIPAVDVECGRLGMIEAEFVDKITVGVHSLLAHLQMLNGEILRHSGHVEIRNRVYQSSAHTGIFYPLKSSGDYVGKGMKLGYVTDFFGRKLTEIEAESSGVILYMLGTPPINKGETIVSIGLLE